MAMHPKSKSIKQLAAMDGAKCKYAAELTEIVGVVSLEGQGGWSIKGQDIHCFEFAAWRRMGQPLVKRKLTILRPVPRKNDMFSDYPEGTIHKIQVLLSVDETRCVFANLIEANPVEADLESVATELRKPVTVKTEQYGLLTLNRKIDWFEGKTKWNGVSVEISFETGSKVGLKSQLKTADALFADSASWGKKVKDFAVQEKLELANEWRDDDDEKPITAAQFLKRMKLTSISIKPRGAFEFWHNDGDLFGGHSIQISGSLKAGLTRSDIPG